MSFKRDKAIANETIAQQTGSAMARTDYKCAANGCPNSASMSDGPGAGGGSCYYHWRESDRSNWDGITREIRANFERMRNF